MINNLSFRSRPIDINKQIPIVRKEVDEDEEEDNGVISRSLPLLPTGMDAEDEEEAHIQEAIKHSILEEEKIAIPTPDIKIVKGYDDAPNPKPFKRPKYYIEYQDPSQEEWLKKIEYDLDEDDYKFLKQKNAKKILSDNSLELIVDRCEKEAAKMEGEIPPCIALQKLLPEIRSSALEAGYNYWVKKREKNGGVPLITALIAPPDPDDPSPLKPFRKRAEELKAEKKARKQDILTLMKMKQLRLDMEKFRTILEMIKKREKVKKEKIFVTSEIFDMECSQISQMKKEKIITSNKRKHKARADSPSPAPQRQKISRLPPKEDEQKLTRRRPAQNSKKHRSRRNQAHSSR